MRITRPDILNETVLANRESLDIAVNPASVADCGPLHAFEFTEALRRLTRLTDCATLFREAIVPFGFDTFACGAFDSRNRGRSVFYIIDWPPAWTKFYMESGFIERDPLLDELSVTDKPFTWSELRANRRLSKAGSEAIDKCGQHGWTEGLVVPVASIIEPGWSVWSAIDR